MDTPTPSHPKRLTQGAPPADRAALFAGTARRIYRLEEPHDA